MSYIPNTSEDRAFMLSTLGLASTDELFDSVPAAVRFPRLELPDALSELDALQKFSALAANNTRIGAENCFAGGGAYNHFIPAVVDHLSSRGEFMTSYTPYQPEVSQGTLQAIFEYQSLVADLLGMEVVNASHYDGATALAEAILMSIRVGRGKRRKVVCSAGIMPAYVDVARTYLQESSDVELIVDADIERLTGMVDEETASVVIAYPDYLGQIPDLSGLADAVHEKGALLVVHTNPIMLGLLKSPGTYGADIVTAEGQPLGIPLSFGGPYLGIFACTETLVRRMPGRLAGETVDRNGRRSYVLTLNTREQHIRREKATSNICTNQGLMALRAAIYLSAMGKSGIRRVAELCYHRAHYAAEQIAAVTGCSVVGERRFFHEFVVRTSRPAEELESALIARGIAPGIPLDRISDSAGSAPNDMLVCVTEMQNRQDIDRFVAALKTEAAK